MIADRHLEREGGPELPTLDDGDDTPSTLRAVTPNLADENENTEDDESPRSARINLHALFEEEAD